MELKRICKLVFFYTCFYTVLSAFFVAVMSIFFRNLDEKSPRYQLHESLIGSNPGLVAKPSNLFWVKTREEDTNLDYWRNEMRAYLEVYNKNNNNENVQNCVNSSLPEPGKVCAFPYENLGACTEPYDYGFREKKGVCVYLKLNKIFGWTPVTYSSRDLPEEMPHFLPSMIAFVEKLNLDPMIWVSCDGENPADIENRGPMSFFPQAGFSVKYFPYTNQENYLSPLVAVFFEEPARGVLINIVCKAWAKNIKHDSLNRKGMIKFQILVE